jgi:hypothetical protein
MRYADEIDLKGRDLLSVSGASRNVATELFPFLIEPDSMPVSAFREADVTAMNGDVADEVHEFENARQGSSSRINRLLLKSGQIIELETGNLSRHYPTRAVPS